MSVNLRYFTPLKSEPKRQEVIAFDIEGVGGPGGFVCGAVSSPFDTCFFTNPAAMWADLLSDDYGNAVRWAFNLEYDLAVLNLDALLSGGAVMGDSGLLWYKAEGESGNEVEFDDAARLYRGYSLADVGDLLGYDKLDVSDEAWRYLRAGVPWSDIPAHLRAEIAEYNCRDADLTRRAVETFQDMLLELGGQLRSTLASCALDLYRREFMPHPWHIVGEATNNLIRGAYYGGRCEPFLMDTVEGVNAYDVNSLYPSVAQSARFPDPGYLDLSMAAKLPADLDEREGIAGVTVRVAPSTVPPLPCRVGGSLFFPIGEWRGAYCLNELRHALDCGVEVLRVDWLLSTRKTFNPFADYIEALYSKRQELTEGDDPREGIIKLLLNSLLGKFGVRFDRPLCTLREVTDFFDPERDYGLHWRRRFGVDYIERPLERSGPPLYANVFLSAYVAAGARVALHKELAEHERQVAYCDTDSMILRGELKTGSGLGEWKQTMTGGTADIVGPKEYRLIMACGDVRAYAKGVPPNLAEQYIAFGWARFERAVSIREAYARQRWPSEWVEVYRQSGNPTPKRCPVQSRTVTNGPTLTLPWSFRELEALRSARFAHHSHPLDAQPL